MRCLPRLWNRPPRPRQERLRHVSQSLPHAQSGTPVVTAQATIASTLQGSTGSIAINKFGDVQESNFGADTANGPIVIDAVGKSGGSVYHGSLYAHARTYQLNSTDAFSGALGLPKAHWTDIANGQQPRYEGLSPWLNHQKPLHGAGTWPTALAVDPLDPNHVLYGNGETLWGTSEADALDRKQPVRWTEAAAGIEETAALTLLSPPTGPHLLAGVKDIGAFRFDELNQSPRAGSFKNPELADTSSIAYAAKDPSLLVRVGFSWTGANFGGVSHDQGLTWTPFPTQPERTKGSGTIALTADGKTLLWASDGAPPALSKDLGKHWSTIPAALPVPVPAHLRALADPINPVKLYLYSPADGTVLASSDTGATFQPYSQGLPKVEPYETAAIYATPAREGDLWIGSDRGLFHSTGPNRPFERIPSLEMVHALGFGLAAANQPNPTLFMFGRVEGLTALFASLDFGKSWIRIDNDTERFADVRCIAGDPRLFGRVYVGTEGRGIFAGDPVRDGK